MYHINDLKSRNEIIYDKSSLCATNSYIDGFIGNQANISFVEDEFLSTHRKSIKSSLCKVAA